MMSLGDFLPFVRRRREEEEEARREAEETARRETEAEQLIDESLSLAKRLQAARHANHFAERMARAYDMRRAQ